MVKKYLDNLIHLGMTDECHRQHVLHYTMLHGQKLTNNKKLSFCRDSTHWGSSIHSRLLILIPIKSQYATSY